MRSLAKLIFVSLTAASLAGCVTDLQMVPSALDGQELVYEDGFGVVVSEKVNTVKVQANLRNYTSDDDPSILVRITNGTGKSVNVSPANVQVTMNGFPHRVYDFAEMVARLDRRRENALFFSGLRSSGYGSAGQAATTTTVVSGSGGQLLTQTTHSGYDAFRIQQEINRENRERHERESAAALKKQKEVEKRMLKAATLAPGKTVSGSVFFARPEKKKPELRLIRVTVRVAGETHTFELNQRPI